MKINISTIIGISAFLLTILGVAVGIGRVSQRVDTNHSSIIVSKENINENEKSIAEIDKVSTGNKDSLSSLKTWTSSNIDDLDHRLEDQKNRLSRTNVRLNHYHEILNDRIWKECTK